METVSIIGIDIAKNVFHLHGAAADGEVMFRKKLTRAKLLTFVEKQPSCLVVMEACGGAHHWGNGRYPSRSTTWIVREHLAFAHARAQTKDAGCCCTGKQDRPHRMVINGSRWGVPEPA